MEYVDYIKDVFEDIADIKVKSMFGGYGIYHAGVIFALIIDNELYFKADVDLASYYKTHNSTPFTYTAKGKQVSVSYWKVPEEIIEDQDQLKEWFYKSFSVAQNSKKQPKRRGVTYVENVLT